MLAAKAWNDVSLSLGERFLFGILVSLGILSGAAVEILWKPVLLLHVEALLVRGPGGFTLEPIQRIALTWFGVDLPAGLVAALSGLRLVRHKRWPAWAVCLSFTLLIPNLFRIFAIEFMGLDFIGSVGIEFEPSQFVQSLVENLGSLGALTAGCLLGSRG